MKINKNKNKNEKTNKENLRPPFVNLTLLKVMLIKLDSNRIKWAKISESKNYSSYKTLFYSYTKNIVFFHT